MSKVVCPFCFEQFERSEVEFRCGNVGRCTLEIDQVLERFSVLLWGNVLILQSALNVEKNHI